MLTFGLVSSKMDCQKWIVYIKKGVDMLFDIFFSARVTVFRMNKACS